MKTEAPVPVLHRITPSMAAAMLRKNTQNRHLCRRNVATLASAMKRGEYHLTHQGFLIDENGDIWDGQHRLHAIVKAGVPIEVYITTGLPRLATVAIDAGRKRSTTDRIKCAGLSDWIASRHVEVMNIIVSPERPAVQEIVKMMEPIKENLQWSIEQFRVAKASITNAAIRAAMTLAHLNYSPDIVKVKKLEYFCQTFISGITGNTKDSKILLLRDYYLRHPSGSGSEVQAKYRFAQHVISCYIDGKKATKSVPEQRIWVL